MAVNSRRHYTACQLPPREQNALLILGSCLHRPSWSGTATPSAPPDEASRHFVNVASTPPCQAVRSKLTSWRTEKSRKSKFEKRRERVAEGRVRGSIKRYFIYGTPHAPLRGTLSLRE